MGYTFYEVRSNDQLYRILEKKYGHDNFYNKKSDIVINFLKNNPHISNIDRIFPGQVIVIPDQRPSSAAGGVSTVLPDNVVRNCSVISAQLARTEPTARDLLASLDSRQISMEAGQGFVEAVGKATETAIPDVRKIAIEYYRKESGMSTKGRYDYQRSVNLRKVEHKLGPLHQLIHPGKTPGEVLRINPNAAVRPQSIIDEYKQLERISKLAKKGSVLLKVASLGETGMNIHYAKSNEERTVLLLDSVSGFVGAAAATALFVAVAGTPVGWVALAYLATASAIGTFGGEAIGRSIQENTLYDVKGNRVQTSMDRAWNLLY